MHLLLSWFLKSKHRVSKLKISNDIFFFCFNSTRRRPLNYPKFRKLGSVVDLVPEASCSMHRLVFHMFTRLLWPRVEIFNVREASHCICCTKRASLLVLLIFLASAWEQLATLDGVFVVDLI